MYEMTNVKGDARSVDYLLNLQFLWLYGALWQVSVHCLAFWPTALLLFQSHGSQAAVFSENTLKTHSSLPAQPQPAHTQS